MSEIGKPIWFDPDIFLNVVEMLIKSDEVERALSMLLGSMPAYYRDNEPARAKEIRHELHKALFTPVQYAKADKEAESIDANSLAEHWPGRAQVLSERIKALNDKGIKPNVMEIGCGTLWLPYALKARGFEFTYECQLLSADHKRLLAFDTPVADSVNIFVAFELIEHLSNEWEIYQAYLKFGKEAQYVFLSTPLYTWGGGISPWRGQALGHLRTYTPGEFHKIARTMFENYEWGVYCDDVIVLEGKKL